ncbi:MAG: cbb3-type cytochrome oxidase assembly protein CcoS [Cyclobacteriaceae bacterium]|nr:cbb3-type cytochrome oxidase assembly protein CcoS [Cyclobacteriaceae bacterium]
MNVIILLIIFSLIVAVVFLVAFFWAVRTGQYDDTYAPSVRILFDDDKKSKPEDKRDDNGRLQEGEKPNP